MNEGTSACCKADLNRTRATHDFTVDGKLRSVSNVPTLVCSNCGEQYFEEEVSEQLDETLETLKHAGDLGTAEYPS